MLYDHLEADRREPFNVFKAIRKSEDEVNLHSRFLHALLSHRDGEGRRPYLRKFLSSIEATAGFRWDAEDAVVRREHRNIDLLVTHGNSDWAVVIENKVWAGDQPGQLGRYYCEVRQYRRRVVLYLTPDGRQPEEQSAEYKSGGEVRKAPFECISYPDDILPWLVHCQQLACDQPSLRESIAQYRSVVEQLTGRSQGGPYMEKLTDLCFRKLPVVMDLMQAAAPAKKRMLDMVWEQIQKAVEKRLGGGGRSFGSPPKVGGFEKWQISYHGRLWPLSHRPGDAGGDTHPEPALAVEIGGGYGLYYGVRCHKEDTSYDRIRDVLGSFDVPRRPPASWWPWWSTHGVPDNGGTLRGSWLQLAQLANDEELLASCAEEIATTLVRIRETLRKEMPELFDDP